MPFPFRAAAGELEARRGPVKSGVVRARQVPQELPHTLAVLVCVMFVYPELSFTYTTDDSNAIAAIDADELVSGHRSPEHRPG